MAGRSWRRIPPEEYDKMADHYEQIALIWRKWQHQEMYEKYHDRGAWFRLRGAQGRKGARDK